MLISGKKGKTMTKQKTVRITKKKRRNIPGKIKRAIWASLLAAGLFLLIMLPGSGVRFPCQIPTHQHGDICFSLRERITCGFQESKDHHHGADCFELESILNCSLEEHVHGSECLQNRSKGESISSRESRGLRAGRKTSGYTLGGVFQILTACVLLMFHYWLNRKGA